VQRPLSSRVHKHKPTALVSMLFVSIQGSRGSCAFLQGYTSRRQRLVVEAFAVRGVTY